MTGGEQPQHVGFPVGQPVRADRGGGGLRLGRGQADPGPPGQRFDFPPQWAGAQPHRYRVRGAQRSGRRGRALTGRQQRTGVPPLGVSGRIGTAESLPRGGLPGSGIGCVAGPVHTVWRDQDGDFGRDILADHYAARH